MSRCDRDGQQLGEDRYIYSTCADRREYSLEFSEFNLRSILLCEACCKLELVDYWIKWTIAVIGRALKTPNMMRVNWCEESFAKTRLTNTGFTTNKRNLPFASFY